MSFIAISMVSPESIDSLPALTGAFMVSPEFAAPLIGWNYLNLTFVRNANTIDFHP
jgi:hypothetical protein